MDEFDFVCVVCVLICGFVMFFFFFFFFNFFTCYLIFFDLMVLFLRSWFVLYRDVRCFLEFLLVLCLAGFVWQSGRGRT